MSSCKTLIQFLLYTLIETKSLSLFKQINPNSLKEKTRKHPNLMLSPKCVSLFWHYLTNHHQLTKHQNPKAPFGFNASHTNTQKKKTRTLRKWKKTHQKEHRFCNITCNNYLLFFFLLAFWLLHHHLSFKNWALVIVMDSWLLWANRQTERIGHRTVNTETDCIFYPRA